MLDNAWYLRLTDGRLAVVNPYLVETLLDVPSSPRVLIVCSNGNLETTRAEVARYGVLFDKPTQWSSNANS